MIRRLSALALLLGLALPAAAQDDGYGYEEEAPDPLVTELPAGTFRKAPVRLVYDHVTQGFTLVDASGETAEAWERGDGPALAEVPTDRPVILEVRNANALVYDYRLSAAVRQRREAPRSCSGQGRQFLLAGTTTLTSALTGSPPGGGEGPPFNAGSLASLLGFDLSALSSAVGSRSAAPMQAGQVVEAYTAARQAHAQLLSVVARLSEARANATVGLRQAALRGDVEPVGPLLDALQAQLEREQPGLSDPARVPLTVTRMSPEAERAFRELFAAAAAIEAGAVDEDLGDEFEEDVEALAASSLEAAEALARETAALQDLAATVAAAKESTRQRVLLRPDHNLREVAVEITEDPEVDGVRGTRAGTVRAFLEPAQRQGFGCSVVVSLAFAEPVPQYGVSFDGVVEDAAADGLDTSPAVLFELAPPQVGSVLGAVAGLGLGRNFTPDLYAGASFRLFDPILVTGGAVWRRYDRLPDGLAVGDLLDDSPFETDAEFEDALDRGWTRSLFVGLSIAP